ncbi:transposase [Aminivibrio sp.]|uniref:transposase n=1 Tax=Aminivibrio sp. TaxID=1872489 RepID=UPI001A4CDB77|nr:transposase [Aminivibrio sp.]MBL3540381.1 hypothetical protein [Aminivibrio sp.]
MSVSRPGRCPPGDNLFAPGGANSPYARRHSLCLKNLRGRHRGPLRRITVENPETGENIVLLTNLTNLTNHLRFAASTIGEIYRDRGEIELFFKTLKQNMPVPMLSRGRSKPS